MPELRRKLTPDIETGSFPEGKVSDTPCTSTPRTSVAVIIPCYNSAATIRACLESITPQRSRFRAEVVVVDSSSDGTDQLVASAFPNVRVIHFDRRRSCGAARNVGMQATNSDIVLFIDSDCVAPDNWIDTMTEALTDGTTDAVCGAIANGTPSSASGTVGYYLEFFRFLPHSGPRESAAWLVGGNSGFRRSVIRSIEYQDRNLGEDFLVSHWLRSKGAKLSMIPSIAVRHLNRTGFATVWGYQRHLGLAAAQYRRVTTQPLMGWLERFPWIGLASPLLIVPWVGSHVLRKRPLAEFLRFLVLAPVCATMSVAWAGGFYVGLRNESSPCDTGAAEREGVPDA